VRNVALVDDMRPTRCACHHSRLEKRFEATAGTTCLVCGNDRGWGIRKSQGSSQEGKSITADLKNISPWVQALSVKFIDHIGLFQHYKSMLSDRNVSNDGRKGLLTIDGAQSSLAELQRVPVLSFAEEMVAVRLDVLTWESAASELFKRGKPTFDQLSDARISLDSIVQGHSGDGYTWRFASMAR